MSTAATASPPGAGIPRTIYRSNVTRIKNEYPPAVYDWLMGEIRAGRYMVVELI